MQNPKFKLSLVSAVAALFALSAYAQQAVNKPAAPVATASVLVAPSSPSTSVPVVIPAEPAVAPGLQFGGATSGSSNLDEITRLKFEKAKLELKKDIAKLRADIEEAETGKKPGAPAPAALAVTAAAQVPAGPTPQQMLYNSITLLSVYGSRDKLTAEIASNKGRTIGGVGTVLPTGETIMAIKPDHVIVSQGKQSRRLNPATEDAITYANQQLSAAPTAAPGGNLTPSGMPMIQPFNPSDLMPTTAPRAPAGAPGAGTKNGKEEKKPAGL